MFRRGADLNMIKISEELLLFKKYIDYRVFLVYYTDL